MRIPAPEAAVTPYLVHHLLEQRAGSGQVALRQEDRCWTFAQFADLASLVAAALEGAGVRCGDRVGIHLPKGVDECWALFGCWKAGGVAVPINPLLKAPQIRHIVEDCTPRVLITTPELWKAAAGAFEQCAAAPRVLFLDGDRIECLDPVLPVTPGDTAHLANLGEDLAAILYTSGSTGRAKGVMLSHRNLLAGARIVANYLQISDSDRLLSVLPFSFDYGLNQLLSAVATGAQLVPFTFRFGDELVRALDRHEITGLAGVPTVWAILCNAAPSLAKQSLPHLRYITNSGGAVPTATVAKLRSLLPDTKIFLMYGLTEAFRSTFLPPDQIDIRPTSIGKAIPECEVFLVTDNGSRAGPGEQGILVHRGPTVSLGYWNRPEETAKVLRPNPLKRPHEGPDIVCYSGDLMTQDEQGYFYFVGRNDSMIKSSGYRVSPTEVEEVLMATGQFRQVVVIGMPDESIGQKVHAIAVPIGQGASVQEARLRCAQMLPAYMVPREIELVSSLPMTPNGKVDLQALAGVRINKSGAAA